MKELGKEGCYQSKLKLTTLKKLQGIEDDKCQLKSYFSNLSLYDACLIFSHRTMMTKEVKAKYKSDTNNTRSLWKCESCKTCVDTNKHVLMLIRTHPAYKITLVTE